MTYLITILKPTLRVLKINPLSVFEFIGALSLGWAIRVQKLRSLIGRLREIEPDIADQENSSVEGFNAFWELKRRALQAFQCRLMLRVSTPLKTELTVVDIGDSSGRHMRYLQKLSNNKNVKAIGVNLDPRAISKIRSRGGEAILCRAEELDLGERKVDFYTSFQMVEHLHNPSYFFRNLAVKGSGNQLLVTLPLLKQSRVGFHCMKGGAHKQIFAEDEHILELSPKDWLLLMRHSGWKAVWQESYFQYPRGLPVISWLFSKFWKRFDYEGFWGVLLEKDLIESNKYQDWPKELSL